MCCVTSVGAPSVRLVCVFDQETVRSTECTRLANLVSKLFLPTTNRVLDPLNDERRDDRRMREWGLDPLNWCADAVIRCQAQSSGRMYHCRRVTLEGGVLAEDLPSVLQSLPRGTALAMPPAQHCHVDVCVAFLLPWKSTVHCRMHNINWQH